MSDPDVQEKKRRGIELRIESLVLDISDDVRLFDYNIAFSDKLTGIRCMHRLCRDTAVQLQGAVREEKDAQKIVLNQTGNLRALAAIYFECFLYFVVGMFDVLASITYFIYPEYLTNHKRYFTEQMDYLINNDINPEYSELLRKDKDWIERADRIRDALTHKASAFLVFNEDGRTVFESRDRYDDFEPEKVLERYGQRNFIDLLEFIDKTCLNIYDFIDSYVIIHRKRIPESENSKRRYQNFLMSSRQNAPKRP